MAVLCVGRASGADRPGKCGKNTALPGGLRLPADSAIMSLRELFGKGEYGSGTGTAHLPVAEESAVKKNKETDGRRLGTEEKTAFACQEGSGMDAYSGPAHFISADRGRADSS